MSDDFDFPTFTCENCGHTTSPDEYESQDITDEGYWTCPECGHTDIG